MKQTLTISIASLSLAITLASHAQASEPEFPMPKLTLFSSLGAVAVEDKDFDPEAFELELGIKGLVKLDTFKMIYMINADISDAINSKDTGGTEGEADIHIKDAKVIIPTAYGTFVIAPRTASGQLRDLYSNINIFEYNETHSGSVAPSGMPIFNQAAEAQDVIAYITPAFNNIKVTFSSISIPEANGVDSDVLAARALYDDKKLNIGFGVVQANQALGGSNEDYTRYALTAGYDFDHISIGATYESNQDTFGSAGDFDAYGVVGRYHLDAGLSLAAGYVNKDSDINTNDNNGVVLQVKKSFSQHVSAWVEAADYDTSPDNIAAGINIQF
ncbi:MAG: porin [Amphritea sp.]|nr:porin [Amphritea sp.]